MKTSTTDVGRLADLPAVEVVILDGSGTEHIRSSGLDGLISRWFESSERGNDGLPIAASSWRRTKIVQGGQSARCEVFRRTGQGRRVVVLAEHLFGNCHTYTALFFVDERHSEGLLADDLADRLTPRQREIATMALYGWDNRLIAHETGLKETTVKKHMTAILTRLGVEGRNGLHVLARHRREFGCALEPNSAKGVVPFEQASGVFCTASPKSERDCSAFAGGHRAAKTTRNQLQIYPQIAETTASTPG